MRTRGDRGCVCTISGSRSLWARAHENARAIGQASIKFFTVYDAVKMTRSAWKWKHGFCTACMHPSDVHVQGGFLAITSSSPRKPKQPWSGLTSFTKFSSAACLCDAPSRHPANIQRLYSSCTYIIRARLWRTLARRHLLLNIWVPHACDAMHARTHVVTVCWLHACIFVVFHRSAGIAS